MRIESPFDERIADVGQISITEKKSSISEFFQTLQVLWQDLYKSFEFTVKKNDKLAFSGHFREKT